MARVSEAADERLAEAPTSKSFGRALERRRRQRQRDLVQVGVLTPILVLCIIAGTLVMAQVFLPDTYVEPTRVPVTPAAEQPTPSPTPNLVIQPVDTARLNAGLVEPPPPFVWPEVSGLRVVPDPGRPNEHADYVPQLSEIELRRLVAASSVNVAVHQSIALAGGAAQEAAKAYPLDQRKQPVVDVSAESGYLADSSAFAVVFSNNFYRVQIETVAAAPPFTANERAAVEDHTLHLADHILRRAQEAGGGGLLRTAPEETAVHLRDHIARRLPFRR